MVVDFTVVALFFTETLAKHYGAAAGRPSSAPLGRKKDSGTILRYVCLLFPDGKNI